MAEVEIVVRPERPEDEPHVDAVVRAAFDGPEVATLLQDMRRDHSWLGLSFVAESADAVPLPPPEPGLPLVEVPEPDPPLVEVPEPDPPLVEVPEPERRGPRNHGDPPLVEVPEPEGRGPRNHGDLIGHVSFTRGWVDAPDRLVEVLVLSPLSVRPDAQGRGVGRALIARSFDALAGRPEPVVFLEGDPAYYSRCGFHPAAVWGFERPSVRIPEVAFQARRLPSYDGPLTGALVYPDVFWRHDAVGLRP